MLADDGGATTLPRPGQYFAVVDSNLRRVAVIEVTDVRVIELAKVDRAHARDEGEPETTIAQWRARHEAYWSRRESPRPRDVGLVVEDSTPVVLERFRLVERVATT